MIPTNPNPGCFFSFENRFFLFFRAWRCSVVSASNNLPLETMPGHKNRQQLLDASLFSRDQKHQQLLQRILEISRNPKKVRKKRIQPFHNFWPKCWFLEAIFPAVPFFGGRGAQKAHFQGGILGEFFREGSSGAPFLQGTRALGVKSLWVGFSLVPGMVFLGGLWR